VVGAKVYFAYLEDADYDCVVVWKRKGVRTYTPVQLKECYHIRSVEELNGELRKLEKYRSPSQTVAAMHVNGRFRLDFRQIEVPALGFAEVWLYGAVDEAQEEWFVYGDLLREPALGRWRYPT
jgi:hypothetical protein